MDQLGHLPPQIPIESYSDVNLCSVFYLKAYLHLMSLLGRSQMDLMCTLFWGKNRQHMPACTKTISSWVWKALGIAKTHVSQYPLWGCSACSLWGWCFLGVLLTGQ